MTRHSPARVPEGSGDARVRRASQGVADRDSSLARLLDNSSTFSNQMALGWGAGPLGLTKTAEPADPKVGSAALWMSNGVGYGDDGQVILKTNVGGTITNLVLTPAGEVNQNAFSTVALSGNTSGDTTIAAEVKSDTLNIVAGANVTLAGAAGTDTITLSAVADSGTDTTYDLLCPALTTAIRLDPSTGDNDDVTIAAGTGITVERDNDTQMTIACTVTNTDTQLTDEEVQDIAGPLAATGGTKTGITVTYQDSTNDMDFVVADTTVTGDSGSVALTPGETLTVSGGTNMATAVVGNTLTLNATDTNTTYTAGDGLDLSGTTFLTDLKSNGGLVIESTEIAVDLAASSITGTLAVGDGGSGQTSYTNGQLLIGNTTGNTLAKATLTAGTGISITNGSGSVTIANTVADTNTTYTAGGGLTLTGTEFSHTDTSSQASSDNSGRTYIQDVTLDTFGHVIGLAVATETFTDTNTTYTAGDGLDLSGTTFLTDLKDGGGLVIESTEIAVDLGASSITGVLADGDISSSGNWNTAYGWGNHASAGYLTTDTNTTYSISCANGDNPDEEIIRLTAGGSGSGTDDVVLEAGTGLSVARDGDKITFTNTVADTDTNTYADSLEFATGTGVLTVGRSGALANLTVDLDGRYLESQTSHADVLVDSEFGSEGLMKRGGSAGTYSIVTDSSANWNTAYGWGDHSTEGYITTDTNTTYDLSVPTSTTAIRLDPSTGANDDVTLTGGTNIDVIRTSATELTLNATGAASDTTYDLLCPEGTTAIRLDPSSGDNDDITITAGTGITVERDSATEMTIACTITDTNTVTNAFSTVAVATEPNVVATGTTDTLTLFNGDNVTITTNAGTDTVTIAATDTTYSAGNAITVVGTSINHADTSSAVGTSNSGRAYIQNIGLDAYGHVQTVTTATESVTDTNTYADSLAFATGTGILTVGRSGALADLTVDLDGRYQAGDADLTAIAALSSADSNFIVGSASGWVVESLGTARTSLGVDAAGTDNSTDVALASVTGNYLTINGSQVITAGNVPATLGGTGLTSIATLLNSNVTGFLRDDANDTTTGTITAAGFSKRAGITDYTPTTDGHFINGDAVGGFGNTWSDTATAASGTAAEDFRLVNLAQQALRSDNGDVTTTNATTLYIVGPPTHTSGGGVGNAITNAYSLWVDAGVARFDGGITIPSGTFTLDGVVIHALQDSSESFTDNNTSLMTSAAIADKIEGYSYLTSQTSHADVVVDGDFGSNGLMKRTGSGAYAIVTVGIANANAVTVDDADAADNDYAKFTATGIEGRSYSEVKTDLTLNNVENTTLSTWAGTSNINTVGTIATGTWAATDVAVLHGGTGSSSAGGARTNLGVDIAGTDNSTDVALASVTGNYLTINGSQVITAGNVPVSLGGTGLDSISTLLNSNVTGFLRDDANDTTTGTITAAGFRTEGKLEHYNNSKTDYTPDEDGHFVESGAGGSGHSTWWTDTATANGATAAEDFRLVSLPMPTLDSDNGDVTTTNATTLYVGGSPLNTLASGNEHAITNRYALWVDSGMSRFDGGITMPSGTFTLDDVGISTLQTSSESFADNNTSLMTSAAIADKIEGYSYSTTTGTVTSVAITGTDGIDVVSGSAITSAGTITLGLSNIANSKLTNSTVTVGSTSIALGATQTAFAGLTSMQILGTTTVATSIAGISIDAAFVQKKSGGTTGLTIEETGRITTDSGIRAYGASSVLGPKGGGTVNFIANEAVKTLLNGAISADSAVVTVDSTSGMEVDDAIIFSSDGSNDSSSTYQDHGKTIASVDSTTQITLNSNAYTGSTPLWARDNSWVDVVGTGNMTFRNSNINDDPSGANRNLQFDYAGDSLGRSGGSLKFRTYRRRTPTGDYNTNDDRLTIDADGKLEFNPTQVLTADFKVSGLGSANLLLADASADRVGVGTGSPKATLHVNGSMALAVGGTKNGNFTTSDTQSILTLRVNDDDETTATAPAAFEKGRIIRYVMQTVDGGNTGWWTIAPNSGQVIVKNDEFGATNDGTRGDQLKYAGEMITLIGSNTTDVWIAVKSGAAGESLPE